MRAAVPAGKHAGRHTGRAAVRSTGSFRVGAGDGIHYRHCVILQRCDGYGHTIVNLPEGRERRFLSGLKAGASSPRPR